MDLLKEFWIREEECYSWGVFFAVVGLVLSFFATLWHFWFAFRHKRRCEMLLGIMGAASFWNVFIYFLIFTGLVRLVPDIYNKGIPFHYLVAPCAYFFVLFSLFPKLNWPGHWWVHLLPFILGMIDIIPYAIASVEEKKALMDVIVHDMQMTVRHEYGFIDQKWHYINKFLLAFVYIVAQWRLLYMHDLELSPISASTKQNVLAFTIIYTLQLLLQGGMVLSLVFNQTQRSFILQNLDQLSWISFFFLLFSCWLLQNAFRLRAENANDTNFKNI